MKFRSALAVAALLSLWGSLVQTGGTCDGYRNNPQQFNQCHQNVQRQQQQQAQQEAARQQAEVQKHAQELADAQRRA